MPRNRSLSWSGRPTSSGHSHGGAGHGSDLPSAGRIVQGHPTNQAGTLHAGSVPPPAATRLRGLGEQAATNVVLAGGPMAPPAAGPLPLSGFADIDVPAASSDVTLATLLGGGHDITVTGNPPPNGSPAVYYLPWTAGGAAHTELPSDEGGTDNGALFFTAPLDGCMVVVTGSPDNPTVHHLNANTTLDPTLAGLTDAERQAVGIARMLGAFNELAEADPLASYFSPASYLREPEIVHIPATPATPGQPGTQAVTITKSYMGSVFGVRDGGRWTFYYQSFQRVDVLDTVNGLRSYFTLLDGGQLWPAPSSPALHSPFNGSQDNALRDMENEIDGARTVMGLQPGRNYHVLAGPSTVYNCIAHSIGRHDRIEDFEPANTREDALADADRLYAANGFTRVPGVDPQSPNFPNFLQTLPPGTKVSVVYGAQRPFLGQPTYSILHAARLEPDGSWSSKLGRGPLVRHGTPGDVAGNVNGDPIAVYIRLPH